jgi:hypothetical protein
MDDDDGAEVIIKKDTKNIFEWMWIVRMWIVHTAGRRASLAEK